MAKTNDEVQTISNCRVCLGSGGFIPIFGDEMHPDISIELMIFGRVEVDRDDNFPKLLCKECFSLLNGAVSFRKTAIRSDAILKDRNKESCSNNLFFIVKTEEDISPHKNYEKWPRIVIEEGFVKSNTTDQDTALKVKKEIQNNDEINSENDIAKDESPPKNYEKWPQIFIDEDFVKNNTTDQDTTLKVKKEIKNNDEINNENDIAKEERMECVKFNQDFHLTDDLLKQIQEQDCGTTTIKKQECPICKKMFGSYYLKKHIKLKHSGLRKLKPKRKKNHECPICKKVFARIKAHIKTHNKGKGDYICDVCGKDFVFHAGFLNHRTTHTNNLPFKCDYCPYKGRSKSLLQIHIRTHTGDYRYKCDQCNAKYTTKSNLNKHMQRHRGAIDFLCDSCNRGFYTKLELQRHISVIHLGIKNHLCNLCGAAFGYKNSLTKHMHKVHKKIRGKGGRMALYLKLQSENVK